MRSTSLSFSLGLALVASSAPGCQNPTGPERELSGELVYGRHCARCHGRDGAGTPEVPGAKNLSDPGSMSALNDERLRMVIQNGKPPGMPGFQGQFAEPTLKVLVAFVRSLSDPAAVGAGRPPASGN